MLTRSRAKWLAASEPENRESLGDSDDSSYSDQEPEISVNDNNSDKDNDEDSIDDHNDEDDDEESTEYNNNKRKKCSTISSTKSCYLGKDQETKLITEPPQVGKSKSKNIVTEKSGVKGGGKEANTPLSAWKLFFDDNILVKIVLYTNQKLNKIQGKYQHSRDCPMTNIEEMQVLFGLLYLAGTLKLSHTKTTDLWARDGTSPPYFKAVMSEARFRQLLRALRFDDLDTRKERSQNDKLAPIREIVDHINEKFLSLYSVHENVTIDEMMFSFKGRYSFRQYLPMKPHSYGIKTFALVDSSNYYTSFIEIYTGKQPPGPFFVDNTPKVVVQRIAKSILGTGRNITMDNWFSSIPLIDELQTSHKTTVVATLKKNKKEIPPEFLATKTRPIFSSLIGYSNGKVSSSYVPKKNKCVLVVSSMHEECKIDESTGSKQKPETIMYYNETKGGVDTVDQLRGNYTVARYSYRWPLTVFFSLMDLVGINSQIIYSENTGTELSRKSFLTEIVKNLTKPFMIKRVTIPQLSTPLRMTIKQILNISNKEVSVIVQDKSRQLCAYCPRKKNRKTTITCYSCESYICKEHTRTMCERCYMCNDSTEE